jgi:hypothetical protein
MQTINYDFICNLPTYISEPKKLRNLTTDY